MNAAHKTIDALGQEKATIGEIVRAAEEGRRKPLRGRALVELARKFGLDWEDTGTGWKPGTVLVAKDRKYVVLETGSIVRVQERGGKLYRPTPGLTKKQRNRLKRTIRAKAKAPGVGK